MKVVIFVVNKKQDMFCKESMCKAINMKKHKLEDIKHLSISIPYSTIPNAELYS